MRNDTATDRFAPETSDINLPAHEIRMPELTDEDLTFRVHAMSLSARVVETAISLAKDSGEPVERPLTDAQLKRAFDIHVAEDLILTRLLIDHAEFMALPEEVRLLQIRLKLR